MFSANNFDDKVMDFFGESVKDSYRKGYNRGYSGKPREGNLIGDLFGGRPQNKGKSNPFSSRFGRSDDVTGSQHAYEFNKGYDTGQSDRRGVFEIEAEMDDTRF